MKILLSPSCQSLTGSLDNYTGYSVQRRADGFFAQRKSKGSVPPDGHWRFIVLCAEQAQRGLYIRDIKVSSFELLQALHEAGLLQVAPLICWPMYNAEQILELKNRYSL